MAQEQKSTRCKEQKAPKNTSCPRAARLVSLAERTALFWAASQLARQGWNWLPAPCRGRHSMAAGKQNLVSVADVVLGTAGPLANMSDGLGRR